MEKDRQRLAVSFRPMQIEDVRSVHEIDTLSFSMPWSERSFAFELAENRNSIVWVAEIEPPDNSPVIVGVIVVWVILDEAHVATIATHPDYRGMGIARRILAKVLLAAYTRGARLAYLEVRRSNETAKILYRKFGFNVVGTRPRYYKDNNEDALLMTLEPLQPEELRRLEG
jgi:[ribosomal protein S18]-alanine N-acetyltransferase